MYTDMPAPVSVRCDHCHALAATPDGRSVTGPDRAGARQRIHALGWTASGGRHLCSRCAAREACHAAGHDFGPWTQVTEHPEQLVERVCLACGADQIAPAWALAPARTRRALRAAAVAS